MTKTKHEQQREIERRRTFAIISHPDAGKTTLTEKLLLYGGAIRLAGTVKGRKAKKFATSDWMEIEKQRGISVTSSVMQFEYMDHVINILDTPGHQDFSEDTYRTLTAADSAVMLIDAAKGVEAQTIKLFEVCRLRKIPVFTFINKMDRHGREPLDLMEEIENILHMRSCPMNWPIGMGDDFKGIYDRQNERLELFSRSEESVYVNAKGMGAAHPALTEALGEQMHEKLREDIELLDIAGDPYDEEKIRRGELTPVFFGSAITSFGVRSFLEQFIKLAPSPSPRESDSGPVDTLEPFSGFVFKIQANMNPDHRDRIAFLRICSGKFERGMSVKHVRKKKTIKLAQPQQFFAQERQIAEEAYAGDIIGLYDPGIFHIGDTVCAQTEFQFQKLPQFSPEHFAKVTMKNALKHKQFDKGVKQLIEEGAIQMFRSLQGTEDHILGVVGELQFEVFEYRLKQEYGADIILQRLPYLFARWVRPKEDKEMPDIKQFQHHSTHCVKDREGRTVILFESEFAFRWIQEKHPDIDFLATAPLE